ncbi:sulfatase family protein [Halanaeroarchaeum sulfurireducens]|uniref:Sulfatase n=1 Tax=Halanaeroarchaeum sulfurireducens TaxID=1604004 RepID=A0A0F7PDK9_9EURY|nr:sulfatase-like hydrolase/transferase [Halanaeroarchaeum sulfurireducens]AKH97423.1 sulfatase [Halanaeroarchaeum sulfurireducens]ALG81819.1 sulfatase [Halanaeroarchaeum sulfurireducens]
MEVPQDAWGYIANKDELTDGELEILRSLYRAEIAYLEERIEEIVDLLKARGEWEDTLFIVRSDHGENIGDHGLMDHQYPLYDTLLHIPLFVHGGPFEDDQIDDLVQLVDFPATILDVLDSDAPEAREQFQGIAFHPVANETRDDAIAEYMAPQPSMEALEKRVGDFPESVYEDDRSPRAIRTDRWKLIRGSDGSIELYDTENDPGETTDLSEEREDIRQELGTKLDDWLTSFECADQTGYVVMREETKDRLEDLGYLQ